TFITASALAFFSALIAPAALCPDRRTGLLGLYLSGPLAPPRHPGAHAARGFGVVLLITIGPLLFMLMANVVAGFGPSAGETPKLLLRIVVTGLVTAALYTSLSMAVSSLTTRRA